MLATKIDLLLSRLNERAHEKEAMKATVQATDSQMTYELCGEVGHLGNNCSRPVKMPHISTTDSDKVTIMGETISLARKEVIRTSIQITIRINLP